MYPPSAKKDWLKTVVMDGASIGATVSIRPGVVIGRNALIGMGSVVTRSVPDGERWSGIPAKKMKDKLDDNI